mgnify:CR=1 FL=1
MPMYSRHCSLVRLLVDSAKAPALADYAEVPDLMYYTKYTDARHKLTSPLCDKNKADATIALATHLLGAKTHTNLGAYFHHSADPK